MLTWRPRSGLVEEAREGGQHDHISECDFQALNCYLSFNGQDAWIDNESTIHIRQRSSPQINVTKQQTGWIFLLYKRSTYVYSWWVLYRCEYFIYEQYMITDVKTYYTQTMIEIYGYLGSILTWKVVLALLLWIFYAEDNIGSYF